MGDAGTRLARRAVAAALWRLPAGQALVRAQARRAYERHVVRAMTHDTALFERASPLPRGYGFGMSERAVEYGWALAQRPAGHALDAGSTFNHPYTLDVLLPRLASLTIVTLAPEATSFPERGVDYRYHDLRELPFDDGTFDTVICLSVLEHVGLDTSIYGVPGPMAEDPQREAVGAVRELARVGARGGRLLISVPFGRAESHGWVRVLDEPALRELIEAAEPRAVDLRVFRDSGDGWQVSSIGDAARAGYREHRADAVACARLTL